VAASDFGFETKRERMLRALEQYLGDLPGIKRVRRGSLDDEQLSDKELPGIVIIETNTDYQWEHRHPSRRLKSRNRILLELQWKARKEGLGQRAKLSKYREMFVGAVLNHIVNNPTLTLTLEGESEEECFARDLTSEIAVSYPLVEYPNISALVALNAIGTEVFDDRVVGAFNQAVLEETEVKE